MKSKLLYIFFINFLLFLCFNIGYTKSFREKHIRINDITFSIPKNWNISSKSSIFINNILIVDNSKSTGNVTHTIIPNSSSFDFYAYDKYESKIYVTAIHSKDSSQKDLRTRLTSDNLRELNYQFKSMLEKLLSEKYKHGKFYWIGLNQKKINNINVIQSYFRVTLQNSNKMMFTFISFPHNDSIINILVEWNENSSWNKEEIDSVIESFKIVKYEEKVITNNADTIIDRIYSAGLKGLKSVFVPICIIFIIILSRVVYLNIRNKKNNK